MGLIGVARVEGGTSEVVPLAGEEPTQAKDALKHLGAVANGRHEATSQLALAESQIRGQRLHALSGVKKTDDRRLNRAVRRAGDHEPRRRRRLEQAEHGAGSASPRSSSPGSRPSSEIAIRRSRSSDSGNPSAGPPAPGRNRTPKISSPGSVRECHGPVSGPATTAPSPRRQTMSAQASGITRTQIAALVRSAHSWGRGLTVYDELTTDLYAASSRTFVGQLLSLFGLRDVADRAPDPQGLGYPKLSAEYVVAANPAIVLLSDTICCGQSAATLARRSGWSQIRAVRDHTIVALNDDIASRWGPRTVDLAAAIAGAVKRAHAAGLRG